MTGILPDINGITATAASRTATPSPVSGSPEPGPSSASIEVTDGIGFFGNLIKELDTLFGGGGFLVSKFTKEGS